MLTEDELDDIAKRATRGWWTDEEIYDASRDGPTRTDITVRAYADLLKLWVEVKSWRAAMENLKRQTPLI